MKRSNEYFFSLTAPSIAGFSFKYKRQIKNKIFFKGGLIDIYARRYSVFPQNLSMVFPTHTNTISAGVQLGLEFRKSLKEKFTLFHGPSPSLIYRVRITEIENPVLPEKDRRKIEKPDVNWNALYTLGLLYNINEHFLISAEINPGLYVEINKSENLKTVSSLLKFSNNIGFFSIGYRI